MKSKFVKGALRFCTRGAVIAGSFGVWLSAVAAADGDWKLESSERQETASPAITLTSKKVTSDRSVNMHAVFFDVRKCDLRVIDQPTPTGSLDAAMRENLCLAGVNGNYFHPDRTPLGLVVSNGVTIHPKERAKLLSGVLVAKPGHFSIVRAAEFVPDKTITQALQAGPFLVDKGAAVEGLEATRRAERTVVLSDGRGKGALLVCYSVTLAEIATILSTPGIISEMKVSRALNLDGGSSTGMWVDATPKPFYLAEFSRVRNFLALVPAGK